MNRAVRVYSCLVLVSLVAFFPERVGAQSVGAASPTGSIAPTGSASVATSSGPAGVAPADPATKPQANLLAGIWENRIRFVEFAADGRLRIVLKPYYGFVYEDTGWIPYSFAASDDPADDSPYVCRLAVRYTGEKTDQLVPAAVIGDGLYVRFFRRLPESMLAPAASATATPPSPSGSILNGAGVASGSGEGAASAPAPSVGSADQSASTGGVAPGSAKLAESPAASPVSGGAASPLAGFWMAAGNADALRLYRSEPVTEFYCYYFSGTNYYRIRYWADDVRFKDLRAAFTGKDGVTLYVPKFIRIGDVLYTCITSTGVKLRNYEAGTYALKDGQLSLKPDRVMYKGTEPGVIDPVRYALSADGLILAIGLPYLSRSKVAALDAEITAHNGKRRPPRKPVFDYMDLDFHWDEVDALRNGTGPATLKPIEPIEPLVPLQPKSDKTDKTTAATAETPAQNGK